MAIPVFFLNEYIKFVTGNGRPEGDIFPIKKPSHSQGHFFPPNDRAV